MERSGRMEPKGDGRATKKYRLALPRSGPLRTPAHPPPRPPQLPHHRGSIRLIRGRSSRELACASPDSYPGRARPPSARRMAPAVGAPARGDTMAYTIRRADYFNAAVHDAPGEGYQVLSQIAKLGINLLAFTGMPLGQARTQLTLFPEDPVRMAAAARQAGLLLEGPHPALLVQGDDELGAFARIHLKLFQARVNVFASTGVADGQGAYSYILYVRPEDYEGAARALGL